MSTPIVFPSSTVNPYADASCRKGCGCPRCLAGLTSIECALCGSDCRYVGLNHGHPRYACNGCGHVETFVDPLAEIVMTAEAETPREVHCRGCMFWKRRGPLDGTCWHSTNPAGRRRHQAQTCEHFERRATVVEARS